MLTPIAVRLFTTVVLRTVENGIALLTRCYRDAPPEHPRWA